MIWFILIFCLGIFVGYVLGVLHTWRELFPPLPKGPN